MNAIINSQGEQADNGESVRQLVLEAFGEFKRDLLDRYKIGELDARKDKLKKSSTLYCFNPLLQTEADVQMLFGGILSKYCLQRNKFVHAEMPIYASTRDRCDLTIHDSPPGGFIDNEAMRKSTLVCAIEIKYATYTKADYDFEPEKKITREVGKLRELHARDVVKFLLIVDEANQISETNISAILIETQKAGVSILSNNPKFG